jgi:hypothetical protein
MRVNCKQILARFFYPGKIFLALFAGAGIVFLFASVSFAPTKPTKMSDSDLSNINGQSSFFSITQYTNTTLTPWNGTGSQNIIRLSLGLTNLMNAHMKSFKMGYWRGGWDQDTTNYFWGGFDHSSSPMTWTGIFVDIGFDNLTNNATRQLNYVEIGTLSASGRISGSLNTVSSFISNQGTGQNNGILNRQTGSGFRTIHFNNEVMSFIFATKYNYIDNAGHRSGDMQGIWVKIPSMNSGAGTN